jgi:hypothetical protein
MTVPGWHQANAKKSACNNNTKQEPPRKKKIYNISNIGEKRGERKKKEVVLTRIDGFSPHSQYI